MYVTSANLIYTLCALRFSFVSVLFFFSSHSLRTACKCNFRIEINLMKISVWENFISLNIHGMVEMRLLRDAIFFSLLPKTTNTESAEFEKCNCCGAHLMCVCVHYATESS